MEYLSNEKVEEIAAELFRSYKEKLDANWDVLCVEPLVLAEMLGYKVTLLEFGEDSEILGLTVFRDMDVNLTDKFGKAHGEKSIEDCVYYGFKSAIPSISSYEFSDMKDFDTLLLNEYFRYMYKEGLLPRNPMENVEMIKKANYMSAQGKEDLPVSDTVTVFTDEEIQRFKEEAFGEFSNGKRKYQQAAAYILMMNTGMRTGEALGLINSDIDLENRVIHLNRGVKEISRRTGTKAESGREVNVGKLKSKTSKRDIPLNDLAIEMIEDLRDEYYFGEDSPLIPDKDGKVTRPANFRKRYYRILAAAGIETKGLHSLRHTFATKLINGRKDKDGNIKSLTPRQVADLLGHTTSEITELYYVKRDMKNLSGITDEFII